jgi:methionyl-tRNA formyltransferase
MSNEEQLAKKIVKEAVEAINWKRVLELIDCLSEALTKFPKPFTALELTVASQFLITHHAKFGVEDIGLLKYAG